MLDVVGITSISQETYTGDLHNAECYIKRDVYNGVEGCGICHGKPVYVKRRTQQTYITLSVTSKGMYTMGWRDVEYVMGDHYMSNDVRNRPAYR